MADGAVPGGLARGGVRAVLAAGALAVVWALAFATRLLPFYPTIVAGGVATGLAGAWVRRGRRATDPRTADERRFPPLAIVPRTAVLAVAVGVAHLGVGHLLLAAGERLLPALTATAASVYERAGAYPLWLAVLLGGVVTASLEELFWRGAVQPLVGSQLRRRVPRLATSPWAPVLATTLVYAAFHVVTGQVALVAAALLGGLVWGWLLERTGSVGPPMLAHATWTSLMLVVPPV